jgi:hypothetical protein
MIWDKMKFIAEISHDNTTVSFNILVVNCHNNGTLPFFRMYTSTLPYSFTA